MEARKIEVNYGRHSNHVTYEYRGRRYEVEYASDYTYCVTPAWIQHRDAQERIDRQIEQEAHPREQRYEDTTEYGLECFWESIGE